MLNCFQYLIYPVHYHLPLTHYPDLQGIAASALGLTDLTVHIPPQRDTALHPATYLSSEPPACDDSDCIMIILVPRLSSDLCNCSSSSSRDPPCLELLAFSVLLKLLPHVIFGHSVLFLILLYL